MNKTVHSVIARNAEQWPTRPFLITPYSGQVEEARTLRYEQLQENVSEIAGKLDSLGIETGTKIAFLLDNGYWSTQLFLGVMAAGRVIVPLNAVAGKRQLEYVLGHCDAAVAFVSGNYRQQLLELIETTGRTIRVIDVDLESGPQWPQTDNENSSPASSNPPDEPDPALLLYTSGSTGQPKGAVLSHKSVVSGGENVTLGHHLTHEDRALCVLPIYHINGAMVTVSAPLFSGGSVVMPDRFSVRSFWDLVAHYQCTWSSIVPTIIKYLLDRADSEPYTFGDDSRLSGFRFGRSATAPLPIAVLEQWEKVFGVPIIETLGLTETAGTVSTNPMPPGTRKPGSIGLAVGNEIRVVDEQGAECAINEVGELAIRGDNTLSEYYKNPQATDKGFFGDWFRTGDLGRIDEEGYLFLTGRLKELIIRGGENIAPREIDDILYQHDAILEAAAVGVDDENYGQEVVACVVVREGYACSEQELKAFCAESIGAVKSPKTIYFMDDLPKGPSGKILRLQLPDLIAKSAA